MSVLAPPQGLGDLPQTAPLFPLPGVMLLPGARLPLNVFEPRYLRMVDDALKADRLIGIIQTKDEADGDPPPLAGTGCLGRLMGFSETPDGRYLITLRGVCRFRLASEAACETSYRLGAADYAPYAADFEADLSLEALDRTAFGELTRRYFAAAKLKTDWREIEKAGFNELVDQLAMGCPFDAVARQALLEAPTRAARAARLEGLMMAALAQGPAAGRA